MTGPVRRLRLAASALVRGEPKVARPATYVAPANGTAEAKPAGDGLPTVTLECSALIGNAGQVQYIAFHSPGSTADPVFVPSSEPIGAVLSNLTARWPGHSLEVHIRGKEAAA
ncbi:MAG: hypothetical protein WAN74_07800 [Thermoplasmata archaeon]